MAPEARIDLAKPFTGDIFSLGMILHFMMTKKLPSLSENVRTDKYNIPSVYSKDIVDIMKRLLKEFPE